MYRAIFITQDKSKAESSFLMYSFKVKINLCTNLSFKKSLIQDSIKSAYSLNFRKITKQLNTIRLWCIIKQYFIN